VQREEIAERVRGVLEASAQQVSAAYLFGSTARDDRRAESDIDVGILLESEPEPGLPRLCLPLGAALERALGCEVDLVILNSAPPELCHRVLRDGMLVLERDRSARIRFEVRARNEYFDVRSRLDEYRRLRTSR
jgi:hypothetical protein